MGMATHASIEIGAPPDVVFRWLIEPQKLTVWLGGAGAMPPDTSLLKVGYVGMSQIQAPGGSSRDAVLRVTAYSPPTKFSFTMSYPGGTSTTAYTLSNHSGTTTLTVASQTDMGATDTSAVERLLEHQPRLLRWFVHHQMRTMEAKLAHGDFDTATQKQIQSGLDDTLAKLKTAIEGQHP
ncbi:MAG: SRPBCC domain-containing protein [Aeromicrobium sp.]